MQRATHDDRCRDVVRVREPRAHKGSRRGPIYEGRGDDVRARVPGGVGGGDGVVDRAVEGGGWERVEEGEVEVGVDGRGGVCAAGVVEESGSSGLSRWGLEVRWGVWGWGRSLRCG